jgi:hypothetical protein
MILVYVVVNQQAVDNDVHVIRSWSDAFAGNINGLVAGLEGEWVYNTPSVRLCLEDPEDPSLELCNNVGEGRTCEDESGKFRCN